MSCQPVGEQLDPMGNLTLKSSNPFDPPVISWRNITWEETARAASTFIQLRNILTYPPFNSIVGNETFPGAQFNETEITKILYDALTPIYNNFFHYSCTCSIGEASNPNAVVDERLRVIGVKRLRVMDASVFPKILTGNIQATIYMIGERGAEMLIQDNPIIG